MGRCKVGASPDVPSAGPPKEMDQRGMVESLGLKNRPMAGRRGSEQLHPLAPETLAMGKIS